jgi:hypothetical protein
MDQATGISHATAATVVTVAGLATGLHYEVLLAGFAGALTSLTYLGAMAVWRRLWSLVTSTLTAGYIAPVLSLYVLKAVPHGEGVSLAILVFSGFVMGLFAQTAIPASMRRIEKHIAAQQGPNS